MNKSTVFGQDYTIKPHKLSAVVRADSFVCGVFDAHDVLQRVDSYTDIVTDAVDVTSIIENTYGDDVTLYVTTITKPFLHTSIAEDPVVSMLEEFQYKSTQIDAVGQGVYTNYTSSQSIADSGCRHFSSLLGTVQGVDFGELLVLIGEGHVVLCGIDNRQLIYYNDFACTTAEDYLYYITLALTHLKIDRHHALVRLAGSIDRTGPLYKLLEDYLGSSLSLLKVPGWKVGDVRYTEKEHIFSAHFINIACA